MTIEAEPFNEQALQAWLDATEDEGRFESAPEQKSARPSAPSAPPGFGWSPPSRSSSIWAWACG